MIHETAYLQAYMFVELPTKGTRFEQAQDFNMIVGMAKSLALLASTTALLAFSINPII